MLTWSPLLILFLGTATRKCSEEGQWNKANYSDCISVEFKKWYDEVRFIQIQFSNCLGRVPESYAFLTSHMI